MVFLLVIAWALEPSVPRIEVEQVQGALDRGFVVERLERLRPELMRCWVERPELSAHLNLWVAAEPTRVDAVDRPVEPCVEDVLMASRWRLCTGRGHRLARIRVRLGPVE